MASVGRQPRDVPVMNQTSSDIRDPFGFYRSLMADSRVGIPGGVCASAGNESTWRGIDPQQRAIQRREDDMTTSKPLAGRRALVTGGSRGIGAEIVRRLAGDGAAVAFTYGASAADAEKLVAEVASVGGTVVAIQADSADPERVAKAVDETVSRLGGLDVLVNNAGVAYIGGIESFPLEEFDRLMAINVRGVFAAIKRAWE